MRYRFALFLLFQVLLLTGFVSAQSDSSPVPTPTIDPIIPTPDADALRVGEWLEGEITNQQTSYLVTLEAGRAYRLDADGVGLAQITSYGRGTGNVFANTQFGTSTWTIIPHFKPEVSGVYQVTVFSGVSGSPFRLRLTEVTTPMMTQDSPVTGSLTVPGDVSLIPIPGNLLQLLTFRATADVPISLSIFSYPTAERSAFNYLGSTGYYAGSEEPTVELNRVLLGAEAEWLLMVYSTDRDQTGSFEVSMTTEPLPMLVYPATPITLSPDRPVVRMLVQGMQGVHLLDTGGAAGLEFQFYDYDPLDQRIPDSREYPAPALRIVSTGTLSDRFYLSPDPQLVEIRAVDPTATIQTSVRLFPADPLTLTETPQEVTLSAEYPIETWSFIHDVERPLMIRVEMLGDVYSYGVRSDVQIDVAAGMLFAWSGQGGDFVRQMFITLPVPDATYGTRFPSTLTLKREENNHPLVSNRLRVWLEPLA